MSSQAQQGILEKARMNFKVAKGIRGLIRDNMFVLEDLQGMNEALPKTREELQEFIRELFHHFLKRDLPGCPIRIHNSTISIRQDGARHRKANEVRDYLNRSQIRDYIQAKDNDVLRALNNHTGKPIEGFARIVTEEDRKFYHISYKDYNEGNFSRICKQIAEQGRNDIALEAHYDRVKELVEERNEERRTEFLRNRMNMHSKYLEHAVRTLSVPFEVLETIGVEGKALVEKARERGLTMFVRQPKLEDLAQSGFVVDVFSAPNEDDETWRMVPVTPEMVEQNDEVLYHGQGMITEFDPTSERSKGGRLPFVVQHCLRVGADINDFTVILPEEFRQNMAISQELYNEYFEGSSADMDVERLKERFAIQDVDSPAVGIGEIITQVLGGNIPKEEVPAKVEEAKATVVESLTEQLRKQLEGAQPQPAPEATEHIIMDTPSSEAAQAIAEAIGVDTEQVTFTPATDIPQQVVIDSGAAMAPAEEVPSSSRPYHEGYGHNPVFYQANADGSTSFLAFRGEACQTFGTVNLALIYAGKSAGLHRVYDFNRREETPNEAHALNIEFNGNLI